MGADFRSPPRPGTLSDLMRRDVITISADAPVRELARLLRERGISGVPVVNGDGDVVGTVSITDILWLSDRLVPLLGGRTTEGPSGKEAPEERVDLGLGVVRDIMTADVFGLPPTATLQELLEFVSRTGLHRVPVLEDRKVVGIVTASDLLGLLV